MPPRVAILPPVPVPYREPLFRALAERGNVIPHVVYLAARQPGWDQPESWFSDAEGYGSEVLRSWQRSRPGRTPITVPRGIGGTLSRARPDCVVSWEYGPATLRALAWARRRGVPLVIFSELTPWSDPGLSALQRRVHRALAPRAAGFIVASSQGKERVRSMGVDPARTEVALQNADLEHIRLAPGPGAGPVRILAVGRLVPAKNLDGLIRAFAEAGFGEGEAELEVRGIGPLAGELAELADGLGVPVRFPGAATPRELGDVYASAGRAGAREQLRAVRGHAARGRRGRPAADRLASEPARPATWPSRARTRSWWTRTTAWAWSTRCAGSSASRSCASGSRRAAAR